jgi:hypothetical protein
MRVTIAKDSGEENMNDHIGGRDESHPWHRVRRFHEAIILPVGSFFLLVGAVIAIGFMIQALLRAQIIPTDVIKTLSTPDLAVAAMSGLVTAATLLGVVVTTVGALVTRRTAAEFDRLYDDVNRNVARLHGEVNQVREKLNQDVLRLQSIRNDLTEYETKFNALNKDFETPEKIRNDILKHIERKYKHPDSLKAEIMNEMYQKIIEEYAKALQALRIVSTASPPA